MLCHQMGRRALRVMRLFKLSADFLERLPYQSQLQPGEAARLTNAAARLSEVYQVGLPDAPEAQDRRSAASRRPARQRGARWTGCSRGPSKPGLGAGGRPKKSR